MTHHPPLNRRLVVMVDEQIREYLARRARDGRCSVAHYVRGLIVRDMVRDRRPARAQEGGSDEGS